MRRGVQYRMRVRWIFALGLIAGIMSRRPASKGLQIYLAESTKGMPCGDNDRLLLLRTSADGSISVNGEKVAVDLLGRFLGKILGEESDRVVFIWPEENADFSRVAEVIDAARITTRRVALLTARVEADPGDCGPRLMVPRRLVVPNPYVQPVGWWSWL
jgi:biopolymer transport protein ExbD